MSPRQHAQVEQVDRNRKFRTLTGILFVLLFALFIRLFQLQILEFDSNYKFSESNRLSKKVIKPERGLITDRNGNILVRNRPSYQINIVYDKVEDSEVLKEKLSSFVDSMGVPLFDSSLVSLKLTQGRWRRFQALRIYEDAPIALVSMIEEHINELPGVVTTVESRRAYPYGTMLAHTLGYTGELDREDVKQEKYSEYEPGDRMGKKGLEQEYEEFFKGKHGLHYIETNAFGRRLGKIETMPNNEPVPGFHIKTTIDIELQRIAEEAFPDSIKGSVVAIDPRNGEVLLILSSPRIDPNIFSLEKEALKKEWANVALDSTAPLNNRSLMGVYPPGSLFKFFTAIAGTENNLVTPRQIKYEPCRGGMKFGRRYQRCWKPSGHGKMNAIDALRESCDVYFYHLGLELGMDKINSIAEMYGLAQKTQIDLPLEKRGLLMDSVTYNKRFERLKWKWTRGLILHLAIGQGELVTPLQMANAFAALGNGKTLFKPHLLKEVYDENDSLVFLNEPDTLRHINIRPESQVMVIEALEEVVSAPGGTGRNARVSGVRVGGKSGSAENPHGDLTHGWFAAVAPLEAPEIAIAVLLENAGHGGSVAGPIAGEVLNYYFERKKMREKNE